MMSQVKMHAFTCGTFVVDKGNLNSRDWNVRYEHPNPMFAFEHPQGIVLYDLGVNQKGLSNPVAWWGTSVANHEIRIKPEDDMPQQLIRAGLKPEDVKYVIISHLHIDHIGAMEAFPHATFVVRKAEIQYAWWPDPHQRETYPIKDLQNTRDFEYLEIPDNVDFDLFGDGSLVTIHTPGHTPGVQSLIVRSDDSERPKVLCADACYLRETLETAQLPTSGLLWSVPHWFASIQRLRHLDKIGYDLWMGHDMDDWKAHCKSLQSRF